MAKHVVLFGGAFDPPHLGHKLVIERVLQQLQLDELWLLPSYASTFLKELSPPLHRTALTKLLIEELNNPKVRLSTIEIDNQLSGSTIETLRFLKKKFPAEWRYSFLIGSDQLTKFHRWEEHETLMSEMQFYVYPRASFPLKPWFNQMKRLESAEISDVSSTQVRNRIKLGEQISDLVPLAIEHYIKEHDLYKETITTARFDF